LDPNDDDTEHSFDHEPALQLRPIRCHISPPLRSALRLLLVSIYPRSSRCWKDPNHGSIVDNTDYSIDREPALPLRPNRCNVPSPLWSALRLLLVPIYPPSARWKDPKYFSDEIARPDNPEQVQHHFLLQQWRDIEGMLVERGAHDTGITIRVAGFIYASVERVVFTTILAQLLYSRD
jgi:hypothetical protein